jgi:hypothetical protein
MIRNQVIPAHQFYHPISYPETIDLQKIKGPQAPLFFEDQGMAERGLY